MIFERCQLLSRRERENGGEKEKGSRLGGGMKREGVTGKTKEKQRTKPTQHNQRETGGTCGC